MAQEIVIAKEVNVNPLNGIGGHRAGASKTQGVSYIKEQLGVGEKEAQTIFDAMKYYTEDGYGTIRDIQRGVEKPEEYPNKEYGKLMRSYVDGLEKYVNQATKYKGDTYRGIVGSPMLFQSFGGFAIFHEGAEISMNGISSWTSSPSVAVGFARDTHGSTHTSVPVVFHVSGGQKHGASINFANRRQREQEVLVSQKSRYRIEKIEDKDGIKLVHLKEL